MMTPNDRPGGDGPRRNSLEQIEACVQGLLRGRVRTLHLVAQGDGLVLRGQVHTYYAKQLAQHAVMAATPMPILANEIEVT
jgi:hypothetical protein